jgi:hypothetical protein
MSHSIFRGAYRGSLNCQPPETATAARATRCKGIAGCLYSESDSDGRRDPVVGRRHEQPHHTTRQENYHHPAGASSSLIQVFAQRHSSGFYEQCAARALRSVEKRQCARGDHTTSTDPWPEHARRRGSNRRCNSRASAGTRSQTRQCGYAAPAVALRRRNRRERPELASRGPSLAQLPRCSTL